MITFINELTEGIAKYNNYKIVSGKVLYKEDLGDLLSEGKLVIKSVPDCFKITNKGGCRLINYIKLLLNANCEDLVIVYNPTRINYLKVCNPEKLYNFSEISNNKLITQLADPGISSFKVMEDNLYPTKFTDEKSLFNWMVKNDAEHSINLLNQILSAKKSNSYLLNKDLKYFSELLPEVDIISKFHGFNEQDVLNSFLSYTL